MKCKVTCVKVWMGLAVTGCIITLILAAIVLASYSFESVIGPLSCKLKKIETQKCCYDEDCIYGKQYIYYFSSNSTHCMSKFDLYNHPHNESVRFREESACYASSSLLETASGSRSWKVNASHIFYVNNDCTQWIESSVHAEHVNTNIMWIAIILSFVGCSCVSMICGFITMYHFEILSCFVDYCACSCCEKYLDVIDKYFYNMDYDSDDTMEKQQKRRRLSSFTNSSTDQHNKKSISDRERLKKTSPPSISPIAVVLKGNNDKSRSIHFNHHQYQLQQQRQMQLNQLNNMREDTVSSKRSGGRKYSKESQISRLSPISGSKDKKFKQFAADKKSGKIQTHPHAHKKEKKELKHRRYTNANVDNDEDDEIDEDDYEYKTEDDIDEESKPESVGLSDDRVFDDEWYQDTASRTTGTGRSGINSKRRDTNGSRRSRNDNYDGY